MAIGWIGVLSNVPWKTLAENVPDIIDGATALFKRIGRTRSDIPAATDIVSPATLKIDTEKLIGAVAALESSMLNLNNQVSDAAKLIGELAENNKELVRAGQIHKKALVALSFLFIANFAVTIWIILR